MRIPDEMPPQHQLPFLHCQRIRGPAKAKTNVPWTCQRQTCFRPANATMPWTYRSKRGPASANVPWTCRHRRALDLPKQKRPAPGKVCRSKAPLCLRVQVQGTFPKTKDQVQAAADLILGGAAAIPKVVEHMCIDMWNTCGRHVPRTVGKVSSRRF